VYPDRGQGLNALNVIISEFPVRVTGIVDLLAVQDRGNGVIRENGVEYHLMIAPTPRTPKCQRVCDRSPSHSTPCQAVSKPEPEENR
jgi:hypothetical protein